MLMKLRDIIRFLWASAAAVVLLLLLFLRVTGCSPLAPERQAPLGSPETAPAAAPQTPQPVSTECRSVGSSDHDVSLAKIHS